MSTQVIICPLIMKDEDSYYHVECSSGIAQLIFNVDEELFTEEMKKSLNGILVQACLEVEGEYIPVKDCSVLWNSDMDSSIILQDIPSDCYMHIQAVTNTRSDISEYPITVTFRAEPADSNGSGGTVTPDSSGGETIIMPGESAYEIALRHGFEGTEEEWLESLKGGLYYTNFYINEEGHLIAVGSDENEVEFIIDENGNLKALYDEGESNLGKVVGSSISSISKTNTNGLTDTYTITMTDGKTHQIALTNGKTPQKGIDYFTENDKNEIVNSVLQSLPIAEEASF